MPAPRVYRTEGLVLRAFDYGEADRILTLYTPHAGKLRAVAKGVRRTKSRMGGHVDLFTRSNLLIARGRQLDIITQADTIENFRPVRDDLLLISYCNYVAELIEGFTAEQLANYPVYALAVTTFRRLGTGNDLELVLRAFELQLLGLTGFRPQLFRCLECGEPIQPQQNYFSARSGGILCSSCAHTDRTAPTIGVPALKMMRNLQSNEAAMLQVSGIDPALHQEVEKRLQEYILFRLESRPRSLTFLDRLRAEGARK